MLRENRVSRILFFIIFLLLIIIPISPLSAAAEGAELYIKIEMDDTFTYDTNEHSYINIEYYSDFEFTNAIAIDENYITIAFYNTLDLSTPLDGPPKNAGNYRLVVTYNEDSEEPSYNAVTVSHDFEIFKANIHLIAEYHSMVYNAGSIPDDPYIYDFELDYSQPLLNSEFPDNQDQWSYIKSQLFGSTKLTRAPGDDVGEYEIYADELELQAPYIDNYTFTFEGNIFEITPAALTLNNIKFDPKTYDATNKAIFTYNGDLLLHRKGSDNIQDVYLDIDDAYAYFTDYNVGSSKPIIFTGYRLAGDKAGNYTIAPSANYSANISQRNIKIQAIAIDRPFDPNYVDGVLDYIIDEDSLNVLKIEFGTDDLNEIKSKFTGELSRTGDNNAGSYLIQRNSLAIPTSGLGGFNTDNYGLSFTNATYVVAPYQIDIIIDEGLSKVYGDSDIEITYILSQDTPLYDGHTLTGVLARTTGQDAGLYDILIGSLTVNGTLAANYNIQLLSYQGAYQIEQRPITIELNDKSSIYGKPLLPLDYGLVFGNLVYGDIISGSPIKADGINAGDYPITQGTLTITNISNYNLTIIEGIYTIEQIVLQIKVDPTAELDRSYGDSDPYIAFIVANEGDLFTGHVVSGSLGRAIGEAAGEYALNTSLIVIKNDLDEIVTLNYDLQLDSEDYVFTIYRDEIYINLNMPVISQFNGYPKEAQPVFYDDEDETTLVSISLTKYEVYYYLRGSTVPLLYIPYVPGEYTIRLEFVGTDNYLPKEVLLDYEIERALLEVTGISIPNKHYDSTVTASIAGRARLVGDFFDASKVSLVTTNAIAVFDDKNVNVIDGIITDRVVTVNGYTLSGEHAAYYEIVQPMTFAAKILPATLNISAQEVIREYNPFIQPELYFNINDGLSLLQNDFNTTSISVIKSYFVGAMHKSAGSSMGIYPITRGTLDLPEEVGANYDIVFIGANYIITPINFTVYVTPGQSKVYGYLDPAQLLFTYEGDKLLPGDRIDGALARKAGNDVGSYMITQGSITVRDGQNNDVGDSGLGNYKVTLVTSPFVIEKRPITIKANNVNITFGESLGELTDYISEGSLAYEDYLTGSISRTGGNSAGTYSIIRGSRSINNAKNYDITFLEGTYTINPRLINLRVDPSAIMSKVYGQQDPEIAFTLSSSTPLIAGHVIQGTLGRAEGENAGLYSLNTEGVVVLDADNNDVTFNYSFNLNTNKQPTGIYEFVIEKRTLVVRASDLKVDKGKGYILQVNYQGFVWGQTREDLDVIITASVPAVLEEGVNIITVTSKPKEGSVNQDKNYNLVFQTGTLTLTDPSNEPIIETIDKDSELFKENKRAFVGFTQYSGQMLLDVDTKSGDNPNRRVTVMVELPNELVGKKLAVLYITEDGKQIVSSEMDEDGNLLFFMDNTGIGYYLVAKPTSGFIYYVLPILLGLLALAGIGYKVFRTIKVKKAKQEETAGEDSDSNQESIQDEILGLKRDFSSAEFGSIIDTGTKPEPEEKAKKSKRKSKKSDIEIVEDNVDLDNEEDISLEDIIDTSSTSVFGSEASKVDNTLDEDDYMSILSKTKGQSIEQDDMIAQEQKEQDFIDLLDEDTDYTPSSTWEDYDDDMDDLIPPAYQNKIVQEEKPSVPESYDNAFGSFDYDDDYDDLIPLSQQRSKVDKVTQTKVEPSGDIQRDLDPDEIDKDMSSFGEFGNIEQDSSDIENGSSNGSKIIKQGGKRRFDD